LLINYTCGTESEATRKAVELKLLVTYCNNVKAYTVLIYHAHTHTRTKITKKTQNVPESYYKDNETRTLSFILATYAKSRQ